MKSFLTTIKARLRVGTRIRAIIEKQKLHYFIQSISTVEPTKRILFGPGFNIGRTFTNHDIIIAGLLRHKGAEIHYPHGRQGLRTNYSFYGGRWTAGSITKNDQALADGEDRACHYFKKFGHTHDVAAYISETDIVEINGTVSKLSETEMLSFQYQGIPIGHDAMNKIRNLNMVDHIHLISDYLVELRDSLFNCMVYTLFFKRVIDEVQPEIIISHDCFYMPWSLLGKLAEKQGIKFYNYYMGLHADTWVYANRKPSMDFGLMDTLWLANRTRSLHEEENDRLDKHLSERRKGLIGHFTLDTSADTSELKYLLGKIGDKPFAVYYSNIFWDLAALDKEIFFQTIEDSILFLINWFEKRQQFSLVLKPHPAEKHKLIPETMHTIGSIIEQRYPKGLPENIHYLDPLTSISSYDLYSPSNCTISWTGTSGMESTIYGTQSISLANVHYRGKGFTIDPSTVEDLSEILEKCLSNNLPLQDGQIELARKYFYLFRFELSINVGIPTMRYGGKPTKLKRMKAEEYLENKKLHETIEIILNKNIFS